MNQYTWLVWANAITSEQSFFFVLFFLEIMHHDLGCDSKYSLVAVGLSPYHLQGNGQRETFNGIVLLMLRTLTDEEKWDLKTQPVTPKVKGAYNCAANEATSYFSCFSLWQATHTPSGPSVQD